MASKTKLELTWIGEDDRLRLNRSQPSPEHVPELRNTLMEERQHRDEAQDKSEARRVVLIDHIQAQL